MASSAVVGILRALLTADTAEFEAGMKRSADTAKAFSRDLNTFGQQATRLGSALTKTLTLPIVGLGAASITAFMDFESSFADVRKTVDAGKPELDALALAFRQMAKEIPVTTQELNKIAALGGQMGVPVAQLEQFTRHVAALGVAVDGISTEEAAAGLAQIGNIAGVGTTQIAEMASTLVHLGNKSNATEGDILEFTKRLMGAGHVVGMTVPEVMALGTTMANLGINAEAGGTAMSVVISKIGKSVSEGGAQLEAFAIVSGKSADEFAKIWKRSPIEAIDLFVKGLSTARASGIDLNVLMGDLGTEGVRVADTLKRLSGATVGVAETQRIANEGWTAGNKHLIEFEEKAKTLENRLLLLWNKIKYVGVIIGTALLPAINLAMSAADKFLPILEGMAEGFGKLPSGIQLVVVGLAGVAAAAGPLIYIMGQLAISAAALTGAFAAKGVASVALGANLAGLAATMAVLAAQAAAVVGVGFAGWNFGKWIGEASGLTDAYERLGGKLMGLTDAEINAGMAARKHSEAVTAQKAAVTGANAAAEAGATSTKEFAEAQGQSTEAAKKSKAEFDRLLGSLRNNTDATRKATAEYEKEMAAVRDRLSLNRALADAFRFESQVEIERNRQLINAKIGTIQLTDAEQKRMVGLVQLLNLQGAQKRGLEDYNVLLVDQRYKQQQATAETENAGPAIEQLGTVWKTVGDAITGGFVQILTGAREWKDGLIQIASSAFTQILGDFTNRFLKGMLDALVSGGPGFQSAFAGFLGFGGGGGAGGGGSIFGSLGAISGGAWAAAFSVAAVAFIVYKFHDQIGRALNAVGHSLTGMLGDLIFGGGEQGTGPQAPEVDPNTGQVIYDPNDPNNPTPGYDPGNPGQGNPNWDGTYPSMAAGGVVMPQHGGTLVRLAEAGYPEMVTPMGGPNAGWGGGAPMTVIFETDGRRQAEYLIQLIPGALKRFKLA